MRIPKRNLSRTDTEDLYVFDMCALSADEVLLACGRAGLRVVSLHTAQLVAHEPIAIREVYNVAFDAHTDTLLLLVWAPTGDAGFGFQLVSLRRNASEWIEVQRLDTRIRHYHHLFYNFKFAVCDSRVLLGNGHTLYMFDVSAEHTLRALRAMRLALRVAGNATLKSNFACTRRDNVTLVAFPHDTSVSLLRFTSLTLRLVLIASVSLTHPTNLLFRGDLLLVKDLNRIVSFRASDSALTERRVLVLLDALVGVHAWALAGDRLVLANWGSSDLLVYAFT